jgi:copper chaperone CopZ
MTCSSCEFHIESEVKKLPGISYVKASYEKKLTTVEYDDQKVDKDKIIAAINSTGYTVTTPGLGALLQEKENCSKSCCGNSLAALPKEKSKDLVIAADVDQIKNAFNQQADKIKFVTILSSTCQWCLQGAESVQRGVLEKMNEKDVITIIVWTNMLKSDDQETAFRAASLFKGKNVTQFFDRENKFGDIAAKTLNPKGEKAWDIYMFFDKDTRWEKNLPRPFDYAHQLGSSNTWADQTKYFSGNDLTKRLEDIMSSL